MDLLLPGVTARRVPTPRLTINVLEVDGRADRADVTPVLFVHGNVSSSLFWQPAMLDLPAAYRPIAMDLRGFGDTEPAPVDATRGVRDYSDDLAAVLAALGLESVHLVGWSLGGGVVLQHLVDAAPDACRIASATLVDPVSPYGFGGTRGPEGTPIGTAGLGSGGGAANPDFVQRLADGDRGEDSPLSPRRVLLEHYVKPPHVPDHLDVFVESMLSTRTGDNHYPGTSAAVEEWPGFAAGDRGVLNTLAPHHFRIDDLSDVVGRPPILWIRGADDVIVSDTSFYDLAYLGSIGAVPGWPGDEVFPPQPMVTQTRDLLDRYGGTGGSYREVVIADAGHGPHLDQPDEFNAAVRQFLDEVTTAAK